MSHVWRGGILCGAAAVVLSAGPVWAGGVPAVGPDLGVSVGAVGPFIAGGTGGMGALVYNEEGAGPTTGPTTVTLTAFEGTAFASAGGEGWTCTLTGKIEVVCTTEAILQPGRSFPQVEAYLDVDADAPDRPRSLYGEVATHGDTNYGNDSSMSTLEITFPDLG